MNLRQVHYSDTRMQRADELTPDRAARVRRYQRRQAWRRRLSAMITPVAIPAVLTLGVLGATRLPAAIAAASTGTSWAVRVCPAGDCTEPVSALSPHQFTTSQLILSGQPQAATHRTMVTLVVQQASGDGTVASSTASRAIIMRAGHAVKTPLATLPSLFAETGTTAQSGTTYTIIVQAHGATLGSAAFTLAR